MKIKNRQQAGFTIVELMIATAVFAVVLLLCATAILQVGRMYYKGITINRVQDNARVVADDVAQAIRFGSKITAGNFRRVAGTPGATQALCLGEIRYTYITSQSLGTGAGQSRHVLWKDRVSFSDPCTTLLNLNSASPSVGQGGQELVGTTMRVPVFTAELAGLPPNEIYDIAVTVSYGLDDVFVTDPAFPPFSVCIGSDVGGQFCAASIVTTNAVKRL